MTGLSTKPPTITWVSNGKNRLSYIKLDIIFAIEFGGTSRFISIFLIFARAFICKDNSCMSATRPAHAAATFGVSGKVFFVDLLTKKLPYAILRSLARTMPSSNDIPTAVAPGMYMYDICPLILGEIKSFLIFFGSEIYTA